MPDVRLKTRIQNKYKTLDEWNSLVKGEFIPLKGEICYATVDNDTVYQKIGDGITDFTELEWLNNVGIDVVDTVNDLSTSAKKDDIAFVKEATFMETIEYQEEIPIVLQGGEQILNIELRQEPLYLSEINFEEIFPEFSEFQGENGYSAELSLYGINSETSIMAISYPASFMAILLGVEQPVDIHQIMHYNDDSMMQYHKLCGMSIKDYMMNMVEIPATEEQMQTLFGEHYNDKTEDNPSYEWIKVSVTGEPLNENSVFLDDANAYVTLEFDAAVDLKGLSMFESYGFGSIKMGEEGPEGDFSIAGNLYNIEEYEKEEQDIMLKFGNVLINALYSGGLQDISYDVYTQKGFHKFDKEWKNLEEEMNIPKVVDTHSDLPKSFIENGLMAVANEEIILPEPTYDIDTSSEKTFEVNPTPSIKSELDKIKQYFIDRGAEVDLENAFVYAEGGFFNPITEKWVGFLIGPVFNDGYNGIMLRVPVDEDIDGIFIYAEEAGMKIDIPDKGSPQEWTFTLEEGGCWYYYETEERDKSDYLVDIPKKLTEQNWFSILEGGVMLEISYLGYETEDNYEDVELTSYEFDNLFRFYDSSKTQIYPQGFYQYSNNRWYHQPDIAGANFDNEDILKKITSEDLGNIDLNTEARHEHSNKWILDSLPYDIFDKLNNQVPANTNARHTHSNQTYLNQITDSNYIHQHSNKTILDKITSNDNVHTHSNKSVLDGITQSKINEIGYNTNARHSHSNKTYLDRITWDITTSIDANTNARHTHNNKGVLDAITNSTILDISNNKSARHSHTNKTILDSITQTHLDDIHHENREVLDTINNATLSDITSNTKARHEHSNKQYLDTINQNTINNIGENTSNRHNHNNKRYLDQINENILTDIESNTEARHKHNNLEILEGFSLPENYLYDWRLLYDGDPVTNIFYPLRLEDRTNNNVKLLPNTYFSIASNGSCNITEIPIGESWIEMGLATKLTFPEEINWINGTMPPVSYNYEQDYYGSDEKRTWGRIQIKFTRTSLYSQPSGEWFIESFLKIDNRLMPNGSNCNFAKIENGQLFYAPSILSNKYNDEEVYLTNGYKRVLGEHPILLSRKLKPNDECELRFKEYDDFIIVFWIVTPKGSRIGEFVSTEYIDDWDFIFSEYKGRDLNGALIGELDFSNATEGGSNIFINCTNLISLPEINLSSVPDSVYLNSMFERCKSLVNIDKLILNSTARQMRYMFRWCEKLEHVIFEGSIKVVPPQYNDNCSLSLSDSPNLSVESLLSFLNILEDNTGEETQCTILLGTTNLAKLTEEQIAIAINKNILLA